MANARLDIQQILKNFQGYYEKSLLDYALTYLETGDEKISSIIGLRAQFIKATSAETKEWAPLIDQLQEKEFKSLSAREAVILGNAYEYGLCVQKNYVEAHKYYLAGADRANPAIEESISNRDRGQSLANACSLYYSETDGFKNSPKEGLKLAKRAAELGSQLGWAHLGCFYNHLGQNQKAHEAFLKAPNEFFAHGRLAQILDNADGDHDDAYKEKVRYHYEQAANLGCPESLLSLASYYVAEPKTHKEISYLAATIIANRITGITDEDRKEAKVVCQTIANDDFEVFNVLSHKTPWQRVETALGDDGETVTKLLDTKAHELACMEAPLNALHIPNVLIDRMQTYMHEPTAVLKAKTHANWKKHLSFWGLWPETPKMSDDFQQEQSVSVSLKP